MAIKPFNSVGGFSVGETPANVILANGDITTSNANLTANLYVTNTANVGNLRTDNLLYANGTPWDFQEAAGANTQIQYNIGNNFAASANFTYDDSIQILTVLGNANITKTLTGNVANFSGNLTSLNANLGNLATANYVNVATQINGNVANFSGNLTSLNANLGNLAEANFVNVSSNLISSNLTVNTNVNFTTAGNVTLGPVGNLHITGGSPDQILKTDGNGNLSWSSGTALANGFSNVTIPDANGNVYIHANASTDKEWTFGTNGTLTAPGNIAISNASSLNGILTDNLYYSNGQPWDLQEAAGSNTQLQFNDGNDFGASANLTFDFATNRLTITGNANVSDTTTTANAVVSTISNTQVVYANANSYLVGSANYTFDDVASNLTVIGNIIADNFVGNISGNLTAPGSNTEIIFNDANIAGATANFTYDKAYNSGGGELNVGNTVGGQIITDNVYASYGNIGNLDVVTDITAGGNISTTGSGGNITMTGGDITGVNNISANSANFTGNVSAANLVGALANGTSNVKVFTDANVEISIGGSANTATFSSTGLYVLGEINTTSGNILSNGNVTANGFINSANANVTGEAALGSVLTSNITATTGNITISAAGSDENIYLIPTGNGTVDVALKRITEVGGPTQPNDAATKEYVDSTSQGLTIHTAVKVTSATNLNATYANGGSTLSTIAITGGKTIQFSAAHNLSIGDEVSWDNSFNGITGDNPYFVYSIPAADTITVKAGYFGAEVTTLTNGTGLTQSANANTGVGATLTNAGANAAISIDGVALSLTNRVLVQGQTNQVENGIYTVTTVGDGSTAWVLTRATDEDTYSPTSTNALGYGDYFFVQQGAGYAGSSYVVTTPVGEILFGYTNIEFSQFSAAGSYSAGNGIAITGTTISANVDGITTDISGGNIVVKTSANLTTPNIGDATFSSITWNTLSNGNVTANNLSIGNIANITGNLRVDGIIQSNGNISSNANINGNNAYFTNLLDVGGNIVANNITANSELSTTNANISTNLITSNATVNLELSGNTANFSGNVVVPNLTVNLEIAGNTANFTGNVVALNTNAGNLLTANFANIASNITTSNLTVNLELAGNTANFTGNIKTLNANLGNLATANYFTGTFINGTSNIAIPSTNGNINLTAGGNTSLVVTATGANITGNLGVSGNFSVGSLVSDNLTANTSVFVGDTTISWNTLTTTSITANQTIASLSTTGVTGLEFLVKGVDSTGTKYSVATVQAVTDGISVDYATFSTVNLGGQTGALAVNIVSGNVELQVTPASSNSTVWTTQVRFI